MIKRRPLRIMVVHNRYRSEQPSGEDRVVDQDVLTLTAAGHVVDVFERRSDDIAGMPLLDKAAVPLRLVWNSASRAELADELRQKRPDIVHIHSTFPLLSPSVVAACSDAGVPAVATLHNYSMVCPTGTLHRDGRVCTDCVGRLPVAAVRHGCYRDSALASVPVALNMVVNRRRWYTGVSRFFCVSEAQRSTLIRAGMPAERLTVKHNFVVDPGRRRSGIPGEHLLFIGRLSAEKGLLLLKESWELIDGSRGTGFPLVIAGAGPLAAELAAWAQTRSDVRLVGLRTRSECAELMAQAAALVAPSEWLEAFGLVVVEAMAAGVPSVAAAHGSFVELIQNGVNGLLHLPGDVESLADCLRRIVSDPTHNAEMGRSARRTYENGFSPVAGLDGLVRGYESALADSASREPA